jgi:hypothetical protein
VRAEPRQPRWPGLGLPLCGPPAGVPPASRPALGLRSVCRAPTLARVRPAAADVQSEASTAEQERGASPPGAGKPGAWESGRLAAADAESEEAGPGAQHNGASGPPKDARGSEVAPGAVWEAVRAEAGAGAKAGAGAAPSARPGDDEGGGGQAGAGEEPDSAGAAWLARIGGRWGVDMPSTAAGWRTRALSYVRDSFLLGYTTIVRAGGRDSSPRCVLWRRRRTRAWCCFSEPPTALLVLPGVIMLACRETAPWVILHTYTASAGCGADCCGASGVARGGGGGGGPAQDAHRAPAVRQVDNVLATALQLVRADELFYWVTPRLERGIANVTGAPATRGAARRGAGPARPASRRLQCLAQG